MPRASSRPRSGDPRPLRIPKIPSGVEMLTFWVGALYCRWAHQRDRRDEKESTKPVASPRFEPAAWLGPVCLIRAPYKGIYYPCFPATRVRPPR